MPRTDQASNPQPEPEPDKKSDGKKPDVRLALGLNANKPTSDALSHPASPTSALSVDPEKPDVRLAYWAHQGDRPAFDKESPTVRLAHGPGAQGDGVLRDDGHHPLADDSLPALLVSFFYLPQFMENRHRYHFRDWVMDSGAFSAHNSGAEIVLQDYIDCCKRLMAEDPSLVEVYSLDVIGDWKASLRNTEEMWKQGVPAIPCFHADEPWDVLVGMAKDYPKIALGGVALAKSGKKMAWAAQCFARVWPKKVHGFAFCSETAVMGLPFHCMTDEHSVLTKSGWKGREEIRQGDEVLAFDDGVARWEPVLEVFDYQDEAHTIYKFDNRTISARVTPNHRWRVWNKRLKAWRWTTTAKLHLDDRIPRSAVYEAPEEAIHPNWLVGLFAWYWTEGCIKKRADCKKPSITIVQSLTANPDKVEVIRALLEESGEKYCEYTTHRHRPELQQTDDDIVTFELYGHVRDRLLELSPNKEIPFEFVASLTQHQLELFVRSSVAADGFSIDLHRVNKFDGFGLWQKDGKNIEQFRVACLLAGYTTSYYEDSRGAGAQTCSTEFIRPKSYGTARRDMRWEQVRYAGHVWCVRVKSGAFFTKCNQHIYVTGNSVDATSWEVGPCKYGQWRAFGGQRVSVRGSKQNLRVEVEWYLDLERRARLRWKKEMAKLEEVSRVAIEDPTIRLALAGTGSDTYLKEGGAVCNGLSKPDVRLVAANDSGNTGAKVIATGLVAPTIRLAEGGTGGRTDAKADALRKQE